MTNECSKWIVTHLMINYPRQYPTTISEGLMENMRMSFMASYQDYEDEDVKWAYMELLKSMKFVPSIAEVIACIQKEQKRVELERTLAPEYFEDEEGYVYKRDKRTGSCELVRRPIK